MLRHQVESSNLRSVGYDEATRTLEIEFHSGGIYQYYDVPPEVYQELLCAPSLGKYFHAHIRNIYQYKRVG
ncbi:MAG: KTSC domain-containing protein [Candidatus Methanomethylicaceae archaeon]